MDSFLVFQHVLLKRVPTFCPTLVCTQTQTQTETREKENETENEKENEREIRDVERETRRDRQRKRVKSVRFSECVTGEQYISLSSYSLLLIFPFFFVFFLPSLPFSSFFFVVVLRSLFFRLSRLSHCSLGDAHRFHYSGLLHTPLQYVSFSLAAPVLSLATTSCLSLSLLYSTLLSPSLSFSLSLLLFGLAFFFCPLLPTALLWTGQAHMQSMSKVQWAYFPFLFTDVSLTAGCHCLSGHQISWQSFFPR